MERDSRFEVLRILSMFFILLEHYSFYGKWSVQNINTNFFLPYGELGVDIFVMISGYFLCSQKSSLKKSIYRISKIWSRTVFYSWLILILLILFGFKQMGYKKILCAFFPVFTNSYWFVSSFICLMVIVPILNYVVRFLTKRQNALLLAILLVINGITPFFNYGSVFGNFMSIGILITCYMTASVIRVYHIELPTIFAVAGIFVTLLLQYILLFFGYKYPSTYGLLPYVNSLFLFLLVINIRPFHFKIINWVSSSVFASYLITQNILIPNLLWQRWLKVAEFENSAILYGLICCSMLLLATILIDKIYILLEKNIFIYLQKKINTYIYNFIVE